MNNWIEVTIKTTTEAVEPITNILYEQGAGGAVIEDPKDFLFQKKNELDWDYVEEEVFKKNEEDDVLIKTYVSEEKCDGICRNNKAKSFRIKRFWYRYR